MKKNVSQFQQKYQSAQQFSTLIRNKFFMSSQSELFLKDHVRLKTGVLMLKIPFYHHRN